MAALVAMIKPRPDDLLDVGNRTPVPKLHMYPDHHFSAINGLARGSDGLLHFQPLKVFLTPRVLWTVFGPATASLTAAAVSKDLDIVRRQVDDRQVRPHNGLRTGHHHSRGDAARPGRPDLRRCTTSRGPGGPRHDE